MPPYIFFSYSSYVFTMCTAMILLQASALKKKENNSEKKEKDADALLLLLFVPVFHRIVGVL